MKKILVGEVSSYKAIVICRFLKKSYPDCKIITFDQRPFTSLFKTRYSDKHYLIAGSGDETLISELQKLIASHSIDLFFPVHSDSISYLLENRHLFGDTLAYMGDFKQYHYLHNKKNIPEIALVAGIEIPKNYASLIEAELPFVTKPSNLSSAKGVNYYLNEEDLIGAVPVDNDDLVIQEFVDGDGCGYSAFVKNGKVVSGYGHLRLAEFPLSGGSSVYRRTYENPEMKAIAEKILQYVSWSGFIMFEFKLKKNGQLVLIEINPRIWGSINQGLQNGINYFESLLGHPGKSKYKRAELFTFLGPQLFYAILQNCLRGDFKKLFIFLKNVSRSRPDIPILFDFLGWMSTVLRFIRK